MIFADLCRIKSFFSDIQRVEKLKFLARHFRRANFFVLFQKFFSETGCVLTLQFQISEGTFLASKIKHLQPKKYFLIFSVK